MTRSTSKTLDLELAIGPENLATAMSNKYLEWESYRRENDNEKQELRNYLFATDTKTTTNAKLPWKNSTTIPKLTQLRDNLHANYLAALFPNEDWLIWEGDDEDAVAIAKRKTIESYVRNKTKASDFMLTISKLLYDWIDHGNCYATEIFVDERIERPDGTMTAGYVGPKTLRISPHDIVFDPTAVDFAAAPKIVRSVKTLGALKKSIADGDLEGNEALNKAINMRRGMSSEGSGLTETYKDESFKMDGYNSYSMYASSGNVEILTFYGDYYDITDDKLYENYEIAIIDRAYVLYKRPMDTWTGSDNIFTIGWRYRPDNLYAMGPLDNLVGMQYRIDHLENLKADAFDMTAFPMLKVRGEVEDFDYGPNERVYVGEEGDVTFMNPDGSAMAADNQIAILEAKMEDMAGAPKQAMGIRTPGEKTAFEVQTLDNAAGRMFNSKTRFYESDFLQKILNAKLEVGRRNLASTELIKTMDSETDVVLFEVITQDDIEANGKLRPVGASHFEKRALMMQNLTQALNTIGADPAVSVHLSGKQIAKGIEDILELERFDFYGENIRVFEQAETQRLMNELSQQVQLEAETPAGLVPADEASDDVIDEA